jgi:hypothetical protein
MIRVTFMTWMETLSLQWEMMMKLPIMLQINLKALSSRSEMRKYYNYFEFEFNMYGYIYFLSLIITRKTNIGLNL